MVATSGGFIHATAEISGDSDVGQGTRIWHYVQIIGASRVGQDCVIGRGVFIGNSTRIGNRVKIQNYANLYGPVIEDDCFLGPNVCCVEDPSPRSVNVDGALKKPGEFSTHPVKIRRGASIGAASVLLPGITIGESAMISAGSVVFQDVGNYVLVAGNPARAIGFVCKCGERLTATLVCRCGKRYERQGHELYPR